MTLRTLAAFCALALLSGCQWEGRPDGASADHSSHDGYSGDRDPSLLGGEAELIEPLGSAPTEAPATLTEPPTTTGTADAPSEVEEALTPGTTL